MPLCAPYVPLCAMTFLHSDPTCPLCAPYAPPMCPLCTPPCPYMYRRTERGGDVFDLFVDPYDLLVGDPSRVQLLMMSYVNDVTAAANRIKQWLG